jgi:hypothetical protein
LEKARFRPLRYPFPNVPASDEDAGGIALLALLCIVALELTAAALHSRRCSNCALPARQARPATAAERAIGGRAGCQPLAWFRRCRWAVR